MHVKIDDTNLNVERVPIKADGACLFNMLSMAMFGNESQSIVVRSRIVRHVVENYNDYSNFIIRSHYAAQDENNNCIEREIRETPLSSDEYHELMMKPYTFGTFVELSVASKIFQRRVYVFEKSGLSLACLMKLGEPQWPMIIAMFSGDRTKGHFDMLKPVLSAVYKVLGSLSLK
uniref:OTU domain-containing protein n=1 Tax=Cacopsylla melanoneura TaxID=428564 RepID=A0A8D8Z7X1_9HEMI